MSDLTDVLLILGSQLLSGLPEETTACSDLTFVRYKFFSIYICLATSDTFMVRATEQPGAEVGRRGVRFQLLFLACVSLQQIRSLMTWESYNTDVCGMTLL